MHQLQQLQLLSRTRTIDAAQLDEQTRGLNRFLIENRLWLEVSDGKLAREYVEALRGIYDAMQNAPVQEFELLIGTAPDGMYSQSVAHLFVRLANAEKSLINRTRKAMRI